MGCGCQHTPEEVYFSHDSSLVQQTQSYDALYYFMRLLDAFIVWENVYAFFDEL